ncbi:MAG: YggS family pyridoxal phosphate-dependent enzyme, partial [Candidatus Tyrphobacter sp.]
MDKSGIAARLAEVKARIIRAVHDCGRAPEAVSLVCVTKTFGVEEIRIALDAGERVFGENRVQEALRKWPQLRRAFPDVELHLLGPLQSNKAREAVEFFDAIESVDRDKIAIALAAEIVRSGRRPVLYVQVNTGAEPQKAGVLPQDADRFLAFCRDDLKLAISGLMCI